MTDLSGVSPTATQQHCTPRVPCWTFGTKICDQRWKMDGVCLAINKANCLDIGYCVMLLHRFNYIQIHSHWLVAFLMVRSIEDMTHVLHVPRL